MNKLLQTTLIATIMATSAFSSTQQDGGTISGAGYIDEEAVMEMEANIKATMDRNAVIHNYNIIQGPAADGITQTTVVGDENKATITALDNAKKAVIEGPSGARIINYDHIMEEDADFGGLIEFKVPNATYFRPTGGGKIQGAVDTTTVTVTTDRADLGRAIDLHNDTSDVMLLTLDCQETDKTIRLTNSEEEMKTVQANIANEVATGGGSNSHSLVVRGAFRFEGDQSRFNQDATTLTFSKSHSEIATPESLFMRPIDVLNKSELVIDAEGVEMPHDVTVVNSQFIVNKDASFTIKSGAKLSFKRLRFPYEDPEQMIWPVGSFSNPLTEVNKNYYEISFNDGSTLKFFYDGVWGLFPDETNPDLMVYFSETGDGGVTLDGFNTSISLDSLPHEERDGTTYYTFSIYDQSVEIYESPDQPGVYITDNEDWNIVNDENRIDFTYRSDIPIKTLTADELSAIYKEELYYAHDGVFSYDYNSADNNWVRRNQVMIVQPGSFDPATINYDKGTWRILDLENSYTADSGLKVTHAVMRNDAVCFCNLDESNKTFNFTHQGWGRGIGINENFEGNKDQGLWLSNSSVDQDKDYQVAFVEKAKTNPWQTRADYGDGYSFDR